MVAGSDAAAVAKDVLDAAGGEVVAGLEGEVLQGGRGGAEEEEGGVGEAAASVQGDGGQIVHVVVVVVVGVDVTVGIGITVGILVLVGGDRVLGRSEAFHDESDVGVGQQGWIDSFGFQCLGEIHSFGLVRLPEEGLQEIILLAS